MQPVGQLAQRFASKTCTAFSGCPQLVTYTGALKRRSISMYSSAPKALTLDPYPRWG